MKKLILLIALVVLTMILTASSASALTDSYIPDNKVTTSQTEAGNSSASATITITMTGVLNGWSTKQV